MPFAASALTTWGIAGLAALAALLIIAAARNVEVAIGIIAVMVVEYALASTGYFAQWGNVPPHLIVAVGIALLAAAGLAFSPLGSRMAALPVAALVGAEALRLPLELVMHHAAVEEIMPPQMTWTGANFDIVTGITALLVALLALRGTLPRWVLIVWNLLGSALLINVVVIAVRSTPLFGAYGALAMNTWVSFPPFVWLPGVLVPAALLGHLLLWRKIASGI